MCIGGKGAAALSVTRMLRAAVSRRLAATTRISSCGGLTTVTAASERVSRVYKRHRSSGGDIAQNNGRVFFTQGVCVCACVD